jgi:hypothetical protein
VWLKNKQTIFVQIYFGLDPDLPDSDQNEGASKKPHANIPAFEAGSNANNYNFSQSCLFWLTTRKYRYTPRKFKKKTNGKGKNRRCIVVKQD